MANINLYFAVKKAFSVLTQKSVFIPILKLNKTKDSLATTTETLEDLGERMSPQRAESFIASVLSKITTNVASDGLSRRIGNIKFYPCAEGTLEGELDSFYANGKCSVAIKVMIVPGEERKLNTDAVHLVNILTGDKLTISSFTTRGGSQKDVWERGQRCSIGGDNLKILEGDKVEISWTLNGTKTIEPLTVIMSDPAHIECEWCSALDDVPVGTEITVTVYNRGGTTDGPEQHASHKATLGEAVSDE